ncbi:MAG: glycosyltransferase [Lachnospiraceae bacterium]|nr:glycosyltransferase [Lachnospiraceae bacterium]
MIRVLQVLGSTTLGGAESRVMDIYRHIDKDRIQFDFLVNEGCTGHFDAEIESLGGHVYTLPRYRIVNHKQYKDAVKSFFEEHTDYAAVHGHMTSTAAIYLPIAKKAGVPLTIAHARSAGVDSGIKGKLTNMLRKHLPEKCDRMFACSDLAAKSVFGENNYHDGKVKVMPNAIETTDFAVDETKRKCIRSQYGVEDKFVIGHVGRFHEAKNHGFLLEIFDRFLDLRPDAVLMIVGDGPLRPQIEAKIEELDNARKSGNKAALRDKVILTGSQSPVDPYYQAFDIFLFPSKFEGMPGTVVEAQAASLRSLIADTITRLVKVTDSVEFETLSKDAGEWAAKLYSVYGALPVDSIWKERVHDNAAIQTSMSESDYDVGNQVNFYTDLYEKASV